MPVMLPPEIDEGIHCSEGERRFFSYLKESSFKGYVLHSLTFDSRGQREIDYVLISRRGVLCLEVKGGFISRESREWIYTDHLGGRHSGGDGPYKQAKDNMHALREKYRRSFTVHPLSDVQFAWGVIFPDQPFTFKGADITEELTFDKRKGLDELDSFIETCYEHAARDCVERNGVAGTQLENSIDADSVLKFLAGDFGYLASLKDRLEDAEQGLNRATAEQLKVLRRLADNRRLIISGVAGSGKTLVAAEQARRISSEGGSVLFLCFNKLLKMHLEDTNPLKGVTYDNADNFLYRHVYPKGDFPVPADSRAANRFYRQELPEAFINMGGIPEELRYDALIVDEAQDILSECMLLCFDLVLRGSLSKGKAAIFYDAKQNIISHGGEAELESSIGMLRDDYGFASFTLTDNCRNTRRIADFVRKATGVDTGEPFAVEGVSVEARFYENPKEQRKLLADTLRDLIKKGISPDDIVVLSHKGKRIEDGCFHDLSALNGVCSYMMIDGFTGLQGAKGKVKLATIQSFKGLEAKAVIVADVSKLGDDTGFRRSINYTSFSRAKAHLVVLVHKDAKKELARALR